MNSLIKKLYNTDNQLSFLMIEARELAEKYSDIELITFLDKEINGYKVEDGIPDYRIISSNIVCDIKDNYGNLRYKEHPVDFSLLSEKVGFKLDDSYVPDGISFVETSINNITGSEVLKPIPKELIKMLNDVFHYNNKHLQIAAAYHKMQKASLEYVLVKSRQNLIQLLQKMNRDIEVNPAIENVDKINEIQKTTASVKKVFVTYAWESEDENELIISFVEFLRTSGFDAFMDRKITQEKVAVNFNQMMVESIQNSNKIIVVLSKKYKEKADKFEGGVGTEFKIILENIKTNENKYIFVYFGKNEREEITPTAILGTDVLDLKKDQNENNFNTLFAKIKEENIINFSEVSSEEIEITKFEIKPFKL